MIYVLASGQEHAELAVDVCPTLTCKHEQPVVFVRRTTEDGQQPHTVDRPAPPHFRRGGVSPTLVICNSDYDAVRVMQERETGLPYIVRRLLPVECGRLQGFPDGWANIARMDPNDQAQVEFWRRVHITASEVQGKPPQQAIIDDPQRLARWHDDLHSRTAEYKMWGNGMALPNALFFVRRAFEVIQRETGKAPADIKLGSLFDGSGTMPLAAVMCGGVAAWASEVEPYPVAVTATHLPKMRHLGDVQKIDGHQIEPVDVLTFGSPCQDLSIAGNRAGLEGARSGLFFEAVRIVREMLEATGGRYPRFAIWENVTGALSSNKGKDFEVVYNELLHAARPAVHVGCPADGKWPGAAGYGIIGHRVVDAQYWGVPQRRRRVYLVADFGGESADLVLFERKGAKWDFTPRWPTGPEGGQIAGLSARCYRWHDRMVAGAGTNAGSQLGGSK